MKKTILAFLGLGLLAASTMTLADGPVGAPNGDNLTAHRGAYLTGLIGFGGDNVSGADSASGLTGSAGLGIQFNQYIAIEGGYLRLPSVNGFAFGTAVAFDLNAVYGALKVILPINNRADIFMKAGAAYVVPTITVSGFGSGSGDAEMKPLSALGMDYYINKNVALTGQFATVLNYGGNLPTAFMGTIGLTLKLA